MNKSEPFKITERQNTILFQALEKDKESFERLNNLFDKNNSLLKQIRLKLLNFFEDKCLLEYENIKKYYDIIRDDYNGLIFEPKNENIDDKILNSLESCIDRHLGLNKIITLFELELNSNITENRYCNIECSDKDNKNNSDLLLKECFEKCCENYNKKSIENLTSSNNDLSDILNKLL